MTHAPHGPAPPEPPPAAPPADLAAVAVILPALNEAAALRVVLPALVALRPGQIIVADNGSSDGTPEVARGAGATVVCEPRRGYGAACWAGMQALGPGIRAVVFLDADNSDDVSKLPVLAEPILAGRAEMVIGTRDGPGVEAGALSPQQRFGNRLACTLIRLRWGYGFRDLGPFRAIARDALDRLALRDRAYGWTVEMQVRALQEGLRIEQIRVPYRRRIGRSKIAGTIRGSVLAGWYILTTLARLWRRGRANRFRRPARPAG